MVIRGIFLHETFNVAAQDDQVMILKRQRQVANFVKKMTLLFHELDDSKDGNLSFDEFETLTADPRMKAWLGAMEFDVHDAQLAFRLLDDGDNSLTADELVKGIARLKVSAKSIAMIKMMRDNQH